MAQAAPIISIAASLATAAYTGYSIYQEVSGEAEEAQQQSIGHQWAAAADERIRQGYANYINNLAEASTAYTVKYADGIRKGYDDYHRRQKEIVDHGRPLS